jgi:hypothetical protein
LLVVIAELLPFLLPEVGVLFEGWLLRPLLRLLGFGPLGPIKGMFLYIVAVLSSTSL